MSNLKDLGVRYGPESTFGATPPTDALQALIGTTFKASGGSGPKRTASGGVQSSQQPRDNVPQYADSSIALTSPSLYNHLAPFRAAVCNQPVTYSGGAITCYDAGVTTTASDITAVASGNKLSKGAGSWGAFPAGSVVEISGFAGGVGKNPVKFCAKVTSVSGANLNLAWPALVDETPGGSVTVKFVRHLRMPEVGTLQTFSFELFNAVASPNYGNLYTTVGVKDWTSTMDIKTAEMSESFSFACGAAPQPLSASLTNATTSAPTPYVHNSNVHFGDMVHPTYGGGFRYKGVVYTPGQGGGQIRLNKVEHKLTRNVNTSGGLGAFGPLSVFTDGFMQLMLTLEVMRDSDACALLLSDRQNRDLVVDIGFCVIDGNGQRLYRYYPALQFEAGDDTQGLAQAGEDWASIPLVAKQDPVTGTLFQETLLG